MVRETCCCVGGLARCVACEFDVNPAPHQGCTYWEERERMLTDRLRDETAPGEPARVPLNVPAMPPLNMGYAFMVDDDQVVRHLLLVLELPGGLKVPVRLRPDSRQFWRDFEGAFDELVTIEPAPPGLETP